MCGLENSLQSGTILALLREGDLEEIQPEAVPQGLGRQMLQFTQ